MTSDDRTPEEIRREIEETRQDLGDTAAALAAKTDVKARAKEKVGRAKQTASEKVDSVKQTASAKKETVSQKASEATPDGAGSAMTQVKAKLPEAKAKIRENPIPSAAIAAFVGGFLFGRITSR